MAPISGKFAADFASFYDAVQKAEVSLKSFESSSTKVESALTRMGNSFSGTKIIQDATLMTKAITDAGGASTLTAKEMASVNATVTEAIAKYAALGKLAPTAMLQLADATKKVKPALDEVNTSGSSLTTTLKNVAGSLGLAFGAAAIVSGARAMIAGIVETASQVHDLSEKLGVSSEAVQRWSFAAKQTGADMENVSISLAFMNKTLAGGTDSTKAALEAAGLQFKAIRSLAPEQAFETITEAIKGIRDPMVQARVAVELFGKSGQVLLPAIKEGLVDIGRQAPVMKDAVINALEAAGDAADKLKARLSAGFGTSAGVFALAVEEFGKGTQGVKNWAQALIESGGQDEKFVEALMRIRTAQNVLTDDQKQWIKTNFEAGMSLSLLERGVGATKEGVDAYVASLKRAGAVPPVPESFVASLKAAEAGYRALSAEQRANLEAGLNLGKSETDIATALGVTQGVLAVAKKAWEDHKQAVAKTTEEAKKYTEAWQHLTDLSTVSADITGSVTAATRGLIIDYHALGASVEDMVNARIAEKGVVEAVIKVYDDNAKALDTTIKRMMDFEDVGVDGAAAVAKGLSGMPNVLREIAQHMGTLQLSSRSIVSVGTLMGTAFDDAGRRIVAAMNQSARAFLPLTEQQKLTIDQMHKLGIEAADIATTMRIPLSQVTNQIGDWSGALKELSRNFTEMAQIGGDGFGTIARTIGFAVKAMEQLGAVGKLMTSGGGFNASNLASIAAGWLGVATAIYSIVQAIKAADDAAAAAARLSNQADGLRTVFNTTSDFSRQLASTLADLTDQLSKVFPPGGRGHEGFFSNLERAQALQMVNIIKELGGASQLTLKQLQDVEESVPRLLELIAQGGPLAAQGLEALQGLFADFVPSLSDVKAAADRLGVSMDDFGAKAKQLEINDEAASAVKAFETLQKAGLDTNVVFDHMSDAAKASFQQMASDALKAGLTIPDGMKPILQGLLDSGDLTDEFGNQLQDLSRFNFAKPLEQMVSDLIAALDRLVAKFADVGNAAATLKIPGPGSAGYWNPNVPAGQDWAGPPILGPITAAAVNGGTGGAAGRAANVYTSVQIDGRAVAQALTRVTV